MSGVRREGAESRMSPATGASMLSGSPLSASCNSELSSPLRVLAARLRSKATLPSPPGALAARLRSIVPKKMKPALLRVKTPHPSYVIEL